MRAARKDQHEPPNSQLEEELPGTRSAVISLRLRYSTINITDYKPKPGTKVRVIISDCEQIRVWYRLISSLKETPDTPHKKAYNLKSSHITSRILFIN